MRPCSPTVSEKNVNATSQDKAGGIMLGERIRKGYRACFREGAVSVYERDADIASRNKNEKSEIFSQKTLAFCANIGYYNQVAPI